MQVAWFKVKTGPFFVIMCESQTLTWECVIHYISGCFMRVFPYLCLGCVCHLVFYLLSCYSAKMVEPQLQTVDMTHDILILSCYGL